MSMKLMQAIMMNGETPLKPPIKSCNCADKLKLIFKLNNLLMGYSRSQGMKTRAQVIMALLDLTWVRYCC
jgi:hypothetical protein